MNLKNMPTWEIINNLYNAKDKLSNDNFSELKSQYSDYQPLMQDKNSFKKNINFYFNDSAILEKFDLYFELCRRLFFYADEKVLLNTPVKVFNIIKYLSGLYSERIVALYLNVKNKLILKKDISIGNYNVIHCTPAEIFIPALKINARNIIIAHNHPSGDASPSKEDIIFTKNVDKASAYIGLKLIDHIIVSHDDFYSFRQDGII